MKSKIITIALFAFTAVAVVFYPLANNATVQPIVSPVVNPLSNDRPKIEVVFVLDTTSSMGGLIQAAKEKIWSIASTMASAQPTPEIKIGLVAYRDRGDEYVTRVTDLSADLDSMYATLMDFQAGGGGDGPESVNQALHDAVKKVSWSDDQESYKVVFLLGDAPPHMDYQDDIKYPEILRLAKQQGIVVNAIQCGANRYTLPVWQQIAQLGQGKYFQVEQAGSAVAVATPFDKKIAMLSEELDKTRFYYGNKEVKALKESKLKATEKLHAESSIASRARRGVFNSMAAGAGNLIGYGELVDDVSSGKVNLSSLAPKTLPQPMQTMSTSEQVDFIKKNADDRQKLQSKIRKLAEKRKNHIKEELQRRGGAEGSLDEKIYDAVREQAALKGFEYIDTAPAY